MSTLRTDNLESLETGKVIEVDEISSRDEVVIRVTSVAEIEGLNGVDNFQYHLKSYWPENEKGGGPMAFNASTLKSAHDGIVVFSPTVPWATNLTDYQSGVGETDGGGSGCFVRTNAFRDLHFSMAGAKSDGTTDDWQAVQNLITKYGQTHRLVGAGNIRVTDTLLYSTSGNVSGLNLDFLPGSQITADFVGDVSFAEGQPIISLFGATTLYSFQRNGKFSNLKLRMSAGSSNISGIHTVGAWDYTLDSCSIKGLDGNGIFIPDRTDLDANPDAWASVKWNLNSTEIINCLDGIQSQAGTGSAGWHLYDCYLINNKRNGVLADAAAWRYIGGAYAYNGKNGSGSGIKYEKHLGVTPSNFYIDQCEIDSNYNSGVEVDDIVFFDISRCRFISKFDTIHAGHTAQQTHVKVTNVCTAATLKENFHRMDSGLTDPITLYDFGVPIANRSSIEISDYNVQNNFGATVVEASSGALASRFANTVVSSGPAGAKNNDFRNFVYSARSLLGDNLTATGIVLNFSQDIIPTGWGNFHNNSTGEFTAPYDGYFSIDGYITVDDISAGAQIKVLIKVGGVVKNEIYFSTPAAVSRNTLQISGTVAASSGDIIILEGSGTGTGSNNLSRPNSITVKAL